MLCLPLHENNSSNTDMKIFWLLFLAACGVAARDRSCAKGYGMTNFDPQRFSGDWYVQGSSSRSAQNAVACVKAHYNAEEVGNVTRIDITLNITNARNGNNQVIIAKGQTSQPGVKSVTQTVFKTQDGYWDVIMEYAIVGSDYDQFAIISTCFEVYNVQADQFRPNPSYLIWSRNQTLDPVVFNTLKIMVASLNGVNAAEMETVDNSVC